MTDRRRVGTVAAVNRYPVKSMQGEALDAGTFDTAGLDGDRRWGLVNTETGQLITAKRVGQLLDGRARTGPDGPEIELPDGTTTAASDPGVHAALSGWLDLPVELRPAGPTPASFTMSFNVDDEDADAFEWPTPEGTFVDLAPAHVLTTAALAAAEAGYPDATWSPHRFRPTVLIESGPDESGFVENDWTGASLVMGEAVLEITMPTIRCSLPTKAQGPHDLERDLQVFKSLAANNDQNLGAYATVRTPGTVRVGDPVEVVQG